MTSYPDLGISKRGIMSESMKHNTDKQIHIKGIFFVSTPTKENSRPGEMIFYPSSEKYLLLLAFPTAAAFGSGGKGPV
jgi:hypothetical protein